MGFNFKNLTIMLQRQTEKISHLYFVFFYYKTKLKHFFKQLPANLFTFIIGVACWLVWNVFILIGKFR